MNASPRLRYFSDKKFTENICASSSTMFSRWSSPATRVLKMISAKEVSLSECIMWLAALLTMNFSVTIHSLHLNKWSKVATVLLDASTDRFNKDFFQVQRGRRGFNCAQGPWFYSRVDWVALVQERELEQKGDKKIFFQESQTDTIEPTDEVHLSTPDRARKIQVRRFRWESLMTLVTRRKEKRPLWRNLNTRLMRTPQDYRMFSSRTCVHEKYKTNDGKEDTISVLNWISK